MSPKKTNRILKTQRQKKEMAYLYGARMVNTYEEPLTVEMALKRNHQRHWKPTRTQMQNALHSASRYGLITRFRDPHFKRVVYAKLGTTMLNNNPPVEATPNNPPSVQRDEDTHDQGMRLIKTDKTLSFVEVSALYHRVPTSVIEEALFNHIRNLPSNGPTIINLKWVLDDLNRVTPFVREMIEQIAGE